VGKQHEQVDIVAAGEGVDGGAAGVAGSGNHDGGALRTLGQHVVHQPRDQLHRHVLECQGRAMKQFEHELVRRGLVERHHGRMAEGGVSLVGHAAEIVIGNLAGHERADHLDGDLPVRPAEQPGDGIRGELRPDLGHIKPAVPGKPGEHHIAESQGRGGAPRRNIRRQHVLQRRG
jgi:hypothetical protein